MNWSFLPKDSRWNAAGDLHGLQGSLSTACSQNKKTLSLINSNISPIESKAKVKQFVVIQNKNKQFFVREKIDGDYFASQITKGEK